MDLREEKFKLNRDIPIPLYYQVKRMVLNELANGNLKLGDKLPSEIEFCEILQLSRPTVRLALNELVAEGVLIRKKRSGTFVAEPKLALYTSSSIESIRKYAETNGRECEVKLLDCCVIDGIYEINARLCLKPSDRLIYLKRIWMIAETPIVYNAAYLPEKYFETIQSCDFSSVSLYEHLMLRYRKRICHQTMKLEAVLASKNDIELLAINNTRAALLYIAELASDSNNHPLCWSISRYRGDKVYLQYQNEEV